MTEKVLEKEIEWVPNSQSKAKTLEAISVISELIFVLVTLAATIVVNKAMGLKALILLSLIPCASGPILYLLLMAPNNKSCNYLSYSDVIAAQIVKFAIFGFAIYLLLTSESFWTILTLGLLLLPHGFQGLKMWFSIERSLENPTTQR